LESPTIQKNILKKQSIFELIEELEKKLEHVNQRKISMERKWNFLTKLTNLYNKFVNSEEEQKQLTNNLLIEKQKAFQAISTFEKYEKTLIEQLLRLKNNIFPIAKAIQDYNENINVDMISFKKGDKIYVLNQEKNGLWRGEHIKTGKIGLFLSSYVQLLEKNDLTRNPTNQIHSSSPVDDAREALGEVNRLEKLNKLSKFFGENTDEIQKNKTEEFTEKKKKRKK
jgi:hypothetical protein